MLRILLLAGGLAGVSVLVPILLESDPGLPERLLRRDAEAPAAMVRPQEDERPAAPLSGRKVRLDADARGHFVADFRLNGRTVPAMVDTGASVVAINRTTARRIGIDLSPMDFTAEVVTANGRAKAAGIVIDRVEIGRVEFRDVPAVVLEDRALSGTLIGMSFLSRLTRFQVEGGALVLEQ